MGAELCSTLVLGCECGRGHNGGPEGIIVLPPEIFGNFICQTVHFWEYLCDNWFTEWVYFALLNTDVEAFLN